MAHRLPLASVVAAAVLTSLPPAQIDLEREFFGEAAERLHRHAQQWYDVGFYDRAWRLWQELIVEYDPDFEPARAAIGDSRLGTVWRSGEGEPYPSVNTAPPSRARPLDKKFAALAKWLGHRHRQVAEAFTAAGDTARARYHNRRVLRFLPEDTAAGEALGFELFAGVYVDPAEMVVLRRSRRLRQVLDFLKRTDFEISLVEGQRNPLLERAGLTHTGVATEHFTIWGDLEVPLLRSAALAAERALWFCRAAFGGELGFATDPRLSAAFAFLRRREDWRSLISENAELFDAGYVPFLLENCSGAYLQRGAGTLYAVWEAEQPYVLDQVVRTVAMDLASVHAPALKEGIGHTVVAMFFGRNLIFLLDQQRPSPAGSGGTSAARPERSEDPPELLVPDLEAWSSISIREAWLHEVPPALLPTLSAARFDNAQRVTAWSICDYLLRRDPELLQVLDRVGTGATQPRQVIDGFDERSSVPFADVEADWRRLWTEDTRLLPMLVVGPSRPTAIEKRATSWLDAVNRARLAHDLAPTGWLPGNPGKAFELALRRGTIAKLTGDAGAYARDAIITATAKPADGVAAWLRQPRGRHLLLRPDPGLLDFSGAGRHVALHGAPLPVSKAGGLATSYPMPDQEGVPVDDSLSLHFFAGVPPELRDVECLVRCADIVVAGEVEVGGAGTGLPRGLLAFHPGKPFAAGAPVTVSWSWTQGLRRMRHRSEFTTAR